MLADRPESKVRVASGIRVLLISAQPVHASEGAFVGGHVSAAGGDDFVGLSSAFVALRGGTQKAEAFNQTFAQALRSGTARPGGSRLHAGEAIVERLLAPLRWRQAPVLLLVADGLRLQHLPGAAGPGSPGLGRAQVAGPTPTLRSVIVGAADDHQK